MKLQQIIDLADKVYSDGLIAQYWDEKRQRVWSDRHCKDVGDGLARFILIELVETFDPEATDEEQLNEAIRVMETAEKQIGSVIGAFEKEYNRL